MHVSAHFAVAGGVATVVSYVCLWLAAVDNADQWFGPFANHKTLWACYTATTVAAYFTVVSWMVAGPDDPMLYWLVAAFNWSASMWVPATAFDFAYGTKLSFVSVIATAACCIAWTVGAQVHHPPTAYNIAFGALLLHHIIADGIIWGYVYLKLTVTRNITQRATTHIDSGLKARVQHGVSAAIHLISAISLLTVAAASGPLSDFDRPIKERPSQNDWRYTCPSADSCACAPDEQIFYIESAGTTHTIPIIWCAFLFAFWSGAWHLISLAIIIWAPNTRTHNVLLGPIAVRTWDYVISAALMILVINTLFGAATPAGTVVSPILQSIIILLGGGVEQFGHHIKSPPKFIAIAIGLFMMYAVEWMPAFYALQKATGGNKAECVGTAPPVVAVFLTIVFAIFSAFPVVWVWFMVKLQNPKLTPAANDKVIELREFIYNAVSCVAKVTLHSFIAIALFGQKQMVHFGEHDLPERPNDATQQQQAYGAALGIVVGVTAINVGIWRKFRTPVHFRKGPYVEFD